MSVPLERALAGETVEANAPPAAAQELGALYEEHFAFVWRSLRALGVPSSLVDDAVQDVFLVVHRRAGTFERRSSIKTWLFGIAFRVAANARRREQRRRTAPLPPDVECDAPGPERHAIQGENARFVASFLSELDELQRAAFTACLLEEMSVPEAAQALGVNVNTLTSRLRVARTKFAAALAEREAGR